MRRERAAPLDQGELCGGLALIRGPKELGMNAALLDGAFAMFAVGIG